MPKATKPKAKLTGVYGLTAVGGKVGKTRVETKSNKNKKTGIHTFADVAERAYENKLKKDRVMEKLKYEDKLFEPEPLDGNSSEEFHTQGAKENESDEDDGVSKAHEVAVDENELEEGVEQVVDPETGAITLKKGKIKNAQWVKACESDKKLVSGRLRAFRRHEEQVDRAFVDAKRWEETPEDELGDILPEDNGGNFILEVHPEGSIKRIASGIYQETIQKGGKKKISFLQRRDKTKETGAIPVKSMSMKQAEAEAGRRKVKKIQLNETQEQADVEKAVASENE